MRTVLAYTGARIGMFVVAFAVFYLCGVRSFLLTAALSLFVSMIASYILLANQREKIADALNNRIGKATSKATDKAAELRERLEEGAAAEDDADDAGDAGPVSPPSAASRRG
ncbi:MAG: DUF4229 domain-containing protein [Nocardiopsaceae bacterium]|nr:DUF4229 domain-containing protein [Nocardiopsaceae bacterium]